METQTKTEFERIAEAYLAMAKEANYQPQARGLFSARELIDLAGGVDGILAPEEEQRDRQSKQYAERFIAEENTFNFYLGCTDWDTNKAVVYAIEAVRSLNAGHYRRRLARKLLEMALAELDGVLADGDQAA